MKRPSAYSFFKEPLYFSAISCMFLSPSPWAAPSPVFVEARLALCRKGFEATGFVTLNSTKFSRCRMSICTLFWGGHCFTGLKRILDLIGQDRADIGLFKGGEIL